MKDLTEAQLIEAEHRSIRLATVTANYVDGDETERTKMSWHPPQIDTSHAMYQHGPKPKRAAFRIPSEVDPRAQGSQQQREQWMRDRQQGKNERRQIKRALMIEETRPDIQDENLRMAVVEGQREAQLLAEAASEIRRRRKAEGVENQCG